MLDPATQKKIALLEAHYKSMGKILESLKGVEKPKRGLSYDQEADIEAKRRARITKINR